MPDGRGVGGRLRAPLEVFAAVSGAAALVYQVVWTRLLTLTFGRTTLAASAVVAGFMGGMGLGAWLYHRARRTRPRAALQLYAALELGIAASAFLLTAAFFALPGLFGALAGALPGGLALDALRIVATLLLLVPPAALMGATYPALCTALIHSRDGVDAHLGRLYGMNTLGAAAGALLAGLWLVEALGLRGAALLAQLANLGVAGAALALARRVAPGEPGVESLQPEQAALPAALPAWLTGAVLFVSGLATLGYEIVWFRALQYLFGNSTYALSVLLAVFLLGLGLGGLALERGLRGGRPERSLALCQLGIAVLALLAIAGEAWVLASHGLQAHVNIFLAEVHALAWWRRLLAQSALALALMLPATLCMGLSFPLATRLFLADVRQLGARVGAATLLANLGSIAGAIGAALLLLPALGTVGGTRALSALNLLLGLALLAAWVRGGRGRAAGAAAAGAAATLWVAALAVALPDRLPFRGGGAVAALAGELVFEEEGDLATVQVWQNPRQPRLRAMTVDGTAIGVSAGWNYPLYSKQRLLAHLPMALDARVRSALHIGLGSGSTLEALAGYPRIERLDVVEIAAAVVRASRHFPEAAVLDDPRVHLVVEDALHFLLRGTEPYDLIVSDGKLNADFSGNTAMLSREFYGAARARLGGRGLLVQWLPLATPAPDLRPVVRTFTRVFPEAALFLDAPHSVFLVGSESPLAGRAGLGEAALARLPAGRELARLRIPGAAALRARWVAGGDALRDVLGEGPLLTWNRPRLEFSAYKARPEVWRAAVPENLAWLRAANERETGPHPFAAGSAFVASTALLRRSLERELAGDRSGARALAQRAQRANPADPRAALMLDELRPAAQPGR